MKNSLFILLIGLVIGCTNNDYLIDCDGENCPLFYGTIFVAPETITETDSTYFKSISSKEDDNRKMFDRRVDGWINIKPYLFEANFSDNLKIEVQVNPEFGTKEKAKQIALQYLPTIGRMPSYLRKDVETIWLHDGNENYGGGNKNLLIHHVRTEEYVQKGILEETFMHEAVHTSLDEYHLFSEEWINAQSKDLGFISEYAMEFPQREDLAETYPICFGLKYKPSAFKKEVREKIFEMIPNRLEYCDKYFFDGSGY